ncbi:phosphate butyryltransferase [candidate division KSB1 bacterium]|nr:phosphate butyryltransferase [candidate division KSB1 bacterium]
MLVNFQGVLERAKDLASEKRPFRLVLTAAEDSISLKAVDRAYEERIIQPILIGNRNRILELAKRHQLPVEHFEIVDEDDPIKGCMMGGERLADGEAEILMNGGMKNWGFARLIRQGQLGLKMDPKLLSHIGVFELPDYSRLLLITDGELVIKPDLGTMNRIIANAAGVARVLQVETPRVALLAAVETVYPSMPATVEEAVVAKMAERGQIKDAYLDGPLSLDVAVSPRAAEEKGIGGEVAGQADILVASNIGVGNGLYKSLFIFAKAKSAGLIVGGKGPIILTPWVWGIEGKLNSIALAVLIANTILTK